METLPRDEARSGRAPLHQVFEEDAVREVIRAYIAAKQSRYGLPNKGPKQPGSKVATAIFLGQLVRVANSLRTARALLELTRQRTLLMQWRNVREAGGSRTDEVCFRETPYIDFLLACVRLIAFKPTLFKSVPPFTYSYDDGSLLPPNEDIELGNTVYPWQGKFLFLGSQAADVRYIPSSASST
ncbi:MAG: hypothetical protein M1825_001475 [Sarcosagium campestre]|nr:MAG: hypothetical protein M1825_001475 [Sarcosagium campestre]